MFIVKFEFWSKTGWKPLNFIFMWQKQTISISIGNCSNLLLLLLRLLEESQFLYHCPNDINTEKVRCCENIQRLQGLLKEKSTDSSAYCQKLPADFSTSLLSSLCQSLSDSREMLIFILSRCHGLRGMNWSLKVSLLALASPNVSLKVIYLEANNILMVAGQIHTLIPWV